MKALEAKPVDLTQFADDLPIMQHIKGGLIQPRGKGALPKTIATVAALGVAGYAFYLFLPMLILAAQIGIAAAIIAFLWFARRPIIGNLKDAAKSMERRWVKSKPFEELARYREKVLMKNRNEVITTSGLLVQSAIDMHDEAKKQEAEARNHEASLISLKKKRDEVEAQRLMLGSDKNTAQYNDWIIKKQNVGADIRRTESQYKTAKEYAQKYAAKGKVIDDFNQKMRLVINNIDIFIADFDVSVKHMKKEYDFVQRSEKLTSLAKSAMGFSQTWQVEYALQSIQDTIAVSVAHTNANLKDIMALTQNISVDDDTTFARLDMLVANIQNGTEKVVSTAQYQNAGYELTTDDKASLKGFGNIL